MVVLAAVGVWSGQHFRLAAARGNAEQPGRESLVATTIESSDPQLAPRDAPVIDAMTTGGRPEIGTLQRVPPTTGPVVSPSSSRSKKPTQRPSGETNGARALVMVDRGDGRGDRGR